MKRGISLVLMMTLFGLSATVHAQWWEQQSPLPTSAALRAVHFADAQNGWIGGSVQTILKTTNGGMSWNLQYTGAPWDTIFSISFVNSSLGWAAGSNGKVIQSIDGGNNWTNRNVSSDVQIKYIRFTSAQNGWIVGTDVLHTTDGGQNWESVILSSPNEFVTGCFLDSLHGWLADTAGIFRTINGGATFQRYEIDTSRLITHMKFGSQQTGYMITKFRSDPAHGMQIFRLLNGGANHELALPDTFYGLHDIAFASCSVMVVGEQNIITSSDCGLTWSVQPSPANLPVNAVAWSGSQFVVVNRAAFIATLNAAGTVWQQRSQGLAMDFECIHFVDGQNGWAGGGFTQAAILRSRYGGYDWNVCTVPRLPNCSIRDICAPDPLHVFAAVEGMNGTILRSQNGGDSWDLLNTGPELPINGFGFTDANNGWAVFGQVLYHTTNGGAAWDSAQSWPWLEKVFFVDALHGWAAGWAATMARTTDGGATWNLMTVSVPGFTQFQFTDSLKGYATSATGTAWKTTNGGAAWTQMNLPNSSRLARMDFRNFIFSTFGWISGYVRPEDVPAVWTTWDEGDSWTLGTYPPVVIEEVRDLTLTWPGENIWQYGCVAGVNSIYAYWEPDAIDPRETNGVAREIELSIYPNPFNANTIICFDAPFRGSCVLHIYNVEGKVVAELRDDISTPGLHTMHFDGSHLASGTYWVKLVAPVASPPQQIVLIK